MSTFKERLNEAIDEREKGSPEKSVGIFEQILINETLSPAQRAMVTNHLGLAYYHMGEKHYPEAIKQFSSIRILKRDEDPKLQGEKAVALRNLSRPEFAKLYNRGLENCLYDATRAKVLAGQVGRKDLVWFSHGVIAVLIAKKDFGVETKRYFWMEVEEYFKYARGESELEKNVWLLGILKDFVEIYPKKVCLPVLKFAKWWARQKGLARREDQIQKLIDEKK